MDNTAKEIATWLRRTGRLRIWSLIITLFGDAVVPRGGRVASETITQLMTHMGVEPGAVRTALSRLTKDGWLVRDKEGRNTFYSLAPERLVEVERASKHIYRRPSQSAPDTNSWHVVTFPAQGQDVVEALCVKAGGVLIDRRTMLVSRLSGALKLEIGSQRGMIVSGAIGSVPDWLREAVQREDFGEEEQLLRDVVSVLADGSVPERGPACSIECAATRCLLVHIWRRITLNTPPLVPELEVWRSIGEMHADVAQVYRQLEEDADSWFDKAIGRGQNRDSMRRF